MVETLDLFMCSIAFEVDGVSRLRLGGMVVEGRQTNTWGCRNGKSKGYGTAATAGYRGGTLCVKGRYILQTEWMVQLISVFEKLFK